MKKRALLLAAAVLLTQSVPALAEDQAEDVTLIGGSTADEISVGETVDLGDYEITVSNVLVDQSAGIAVADPAHKYLSFDVTVLNWMLDDLTVDPINSWSVTYAGEYDYSCAVYASSAVGTWEGTAVSDSDGLEINYIIEITSQDEEGNLSGTMSRMADDDPSLVASTWYVYGYYDSSNGEISLAYGDYIQDGYGRSSLLGNLKGSVLDATMFWEGFTEQGEIALTMNEDSMTENLSYSSVIAPLVEQNYSINVLLPNEAADGLAGGFLVLNMVVGEETYTVTLE
ncbi:MAG: hypothetical protein LIO76_10100 [Clostridiales bacterium]|nr:hypothetical protein [Clostridiales bacterium]